jgi:hypothetical protein
VEPPHCRDLGKVDRRLEQSSCGSVLSDERPSSTVLCLVVTLLYVSEGIVVLCCVVLYRHESNTEGSWRLFRALLYCVVLYRHESNTEGSWRLFRQFLLNCLFHLIAIE